MAYPIVLVMAGAALAVIPGLPTVQLGALSLAAAPALARSFPFPDLIWPQPSGWSR